MNRRTPSRWTTRAALVLATAGIAVTASALPASAGDDEVIKRGNCSGSTDWKLKVKTDDGRLEVEGEIDSNRNGQTWTWKIMHDGDVVKRGTATTHAPSGSFSIERRIVDSTGPDTVGWRARNANSGETCRGSLTF